MVESDRVSFLVELNSQFKADKAQMKQEDNGKLLMFLNRGGEEGKPAPEANPLTPGRG